MCFSLPRYGQLCWLGRAGLRKFYICFTASLCRFRPNQDAYGYLFYYSGCPGHRPAVGRAKRCKILAQRDSYIVSPGPVSPSLILLLSKKNIRRSPQRDNNRQRPLRFGTNHIRGGLTSGPTIETFQGRPHEKED
jgi:hypothetical protein